MNRLKKCAFFKKKEKAVTMASLKKVKIKYS